jgi:hypothetical protein
MDEKSDKSKKSADKMDNELEKTSKQLNDVDKIDSKVEDKIKVDDKIGPSNGEDDMRNNLWTTLHGDSKYVLCMCCFLNGISNTNFKIGCVLKLDDSNFITVCEKCHNECCSDNQIKFIIGDDQVVEKRTLFENISDLGNNFSAGEFFCVLYAIGWFGLFCTMTSNGTNIDSDVANNLNAIESPTIKVIVLVVFTLIITINIYTLLKTKKKYVPRCKIGCSTCRKAKLVNI